MSLTEDEKEGLRQLLENVPDDELPALLEDLKIVRDANNDILSAKPDVRAFLTARGLTHMRQLDAAGRQELRSHLEAMLIGLLTKGSGN